jgi:hypothetical protein
MNPILANFKIIMALLDIAPCTLVHRYQHFAQNYYCLHLKGKSGEDTSSRLHWDSGNQIPNCMQPHPKEL